MKMLKLRMMSHFFSKCDRSTLCIITRNLIEVTIDLNKIVWKAHTFFKKEKKAYYVVRKSAMGLPLVTRISDDLSGWIS